MIILGSLPVNRSELLAEICSLINTHKSRMTRKVLHELLKLLSSESSEEIERQL